jgi:predicted DNA-binding ribbon-helix-helix protein
MSANSAQGPAPREQARGEDYLPSRVVKHSVIVGRHKTSVSLEDAFWLEIRRIADERRQTLSQLVAEIDAQRQHSNLSSAIRLFVMEERLKGAR